MHYTLENKNDLKDLETKIHNMRNGNTLIFVHMNGCYHCDRMKPEWHNVINEMKSIPDFNSVQIERDMLPHLKDEYFTKKLDLVRGFPSILMENQNEELFEFLKERTQPKIIEFVKENSNKNKKKKKQKNKKQKKDKEIKDNKIKDNKIKDNKITDNKITDNKTKDIKKSIEPATAIILKKKTTTKKPIVMKKTPTSSTKQITSLKKTPRTPVKKTITTKKVTPKTKVVKSKTKKKAATIKK
jgi:hypothetical protein